MSWGAALDPISPSASIFSKPLVPSPRTLGRPYLGYLYPSVDYFETVNAYRLAPGMDMLKYTNRSTMPRRLRSLDVSQNGTHVLNRSTSRTVAIWSMTLTPSMVPCILIHREPSGSCLYEVVMPMKVWASNQSGCKTKKGATVRLFCASMLLSTPRHNTDDTQHVCIDSSKHEVFLSPERKALTRYCLLTILNRNVVGASQTLYEQENVLVQKYIMKNTHNLPEERMNVLLLR